MIGSGSPSFASINGNSEGGLEIHNLGNDTAACLKLTGNNNTGTPGQETYTQLEHRGGNLFFSINHNGTERLRIDASGNLNLYGNTVHLYNDANTANTYFYTQNTGSGNAGIKMKNTDGEWTIIANDRLRFYDDDASTERFSIDSSGHVQLRQKSSEGSAQQKLQWISNSGSLSSQIAWGQGSANFDFSVFRTDSQTNYPYGNFRVLTGHGTSPTEALKVTVGGQVLKARHPFFSGLQYAGTGSVPQTGINNWTFTNIEINQGNHFNNSTGYFTCPVAGKYAVMAIHNHRASSNVWHSIYILKNSTTMTDSWLPDNHNDGHAPLSTSVVLSCAANDTISLGWHSSYSAPSTGGTRGNAFAVWLIG